MKPATLDQIAQRGGPEKQAAREYCEAAPRHPGMSTLEDVVRASERMAFLQGIAWERSRGDLEALGALRALHRELVLALERCPYSVDRDTLAAMERSALLLARRLKE